VRGVLITFEGVEGSGKTTQLARLERYLTQQGHRVEQTREPDGTALGAAVRGLMSNPMNQAEASKIALRTVADYLRDPEHYRPLTSWRAALREIAGNDGLESPVS